MTIDIARVLTAAGARVQPPAELTAAVRESVHAQWRALLAARARRRKALLALAQPATRGLRALGQPFVVCPARRVGGDRRALHRARVPRWSFRAARSRHAHRAVQSGIALRRGAVYVDAGAQHDARYGLQIDTPVGPVNHVVDTKCGCWLLERASGCAKGGSRSVAARRLYCWARDQLRVRQRTARTHEHSAPTAPNGSGGRCGTGICDQWTPAGRVLDWAGRELGREIVYSTAEARAEAAQAILSGSIAGLTPREALAAVLRFYGLRSAQRDGQIVIELQ